MSSIFVLGSKGSAMREKKYTIEYVRTSQHFLRHSLGWIPHDGQEK